MRNLAQIHAALLSISLFPSNLKNCWVESRLAWNCRCKSDNYLQPVGLLSVLFSGTTERGQYRWLLQVTWLLIFESDTPMPGVWILRYDFLKGHCGHWSSQSFFKQIATDLFGTESYLSWGMTLKLRNDESRSCYLTQDVIDAGQERTRIIESCTILWVIFTSASVSNAGAFELYTFGYLDDLLKIHTHKHMGA